MDTKSAGSTITDLDLKVKTWAVATGEKLGIKNAKKAKVEVSWNRVSFTPLQPVWKKNTEVPQQPSNRIVYSSTFTNNTGEQAAHNIRMETTSTALMTTSVVNGYSTGIKLGLSFALPNDVMTATAAYERTVKVETTETETHENVQKWSVDSMVPSPPHTKTKVRVEVNENQWAGDFTLPVTIKGMIVVNFYDQNTPGNHLGTVEEDVKNLLSKWGAEVEGSKVKWVLRGTCNFEYGVEHVTLVEHEAIQRRGSCGSAGIGQYPDGFDSY